uniref:Cytochrome P450 4461J3 short isoform n=1 Tax=Maconellicoccus hirsutus TaxID=177089 RepID=A0AAT9UUA7_MACHI
MAFLIVIAFLATVYLSTLLYKKKHQRYYDLLKQFPSPPTYPFIGNMKPSHFVINNIVKELSESHDRVIYWMGPKPILVLKKFDDISIFLNQNSERNLTKISKHWAGEAILNNKHVEWKKSRKLINPAFSSQMIEKYFDVFNKRSFALVDKLKLYADTGKEVDIHKYLLNSNIEGLIENLTGAPIRTSEKEVDDFGVALKDVLHGVARGITSPWLYSDTIYSVYLKLTGNMKLIKELNYLPAKIVRENLKDANEKYRSETADSSKCLIDLMVKAQQKDSTFTETRLEHEFLQLMSAGTDASALNASFTLLMLAIHQDVQQKVYEEITQLVGEHDAFTSDHLSNHLKYLEQCIRETLRMYDPVAVTIRESQKEHVLKGIIQISTDRNYSIKKHSSISR